MIIKRKYQLLTATLFICDTKSVANEQVLMPTGMDRFFRANANDAGIFVLVLQFSKWLNTAVVICVYFVYVVCV